MGKKKPTWGKNKPKLGCAVKVSVEVHESIIFFYIFSRNHLTGYFICRPVFAFMFKVHEKEFWHLYVLQIVYMHVHASNSILGKRRIENYRTI